MASELKLYKKYEAGLRYLLAQSPDSRGLVPETQESAWEKLGTKNGVEVYRRFCNIVRVREPRPARSCLTLHFTQLQNA